MRRPFPGFWWFAAAAALGIIRIIAQAANLDGGWLIIFILLAVGFYRYVTRIPIAAERDREDDAA